MYPVSGRFQEFGNQGRGRGLPVTAGHSKDSAWTKRKKDLHLRGYNASPPFRRLQVRIKRQKSRCAKDQFFRKRIQVCLPELQFCPNGHKMIRNIAELLSCTAITGCHAAVMQAEQFNQRQIGDSDPDHGNGFIPDGINVLVKCHIQ